MRRGRLRLQNVVLSFLLNLGGGVLLANCLCHWLPEVRAGLHHSDLDTFLPLAEVTRVWYRILGYTHDPCGR